MSKYIGYVLVAASLLCATSCKVRKQAQTKEYKVSYSVIDSALTRDAKVSSFMSGYKIGMDSVMNEVLAFNAQPLSKAQPECTLGNFMTDAQLAYSQRINKNVVAAVMNYGGIRVPYISPGPITKGKIYELMPFDNKLTFLEVPGKVLKELCNHIAAYGGWPVSGLTFTIKDKQAVDILINSNEVNDQVIYLLSTSDYLANGGDNCDFLKACKRKDQTTFIRDILIDKLNQLQTQNDSLKVALDKRIKYAE